MPFISVQRVAEIRRELKKAFPLFKLSVRCENYSTVRVAILSGPVNLLEKPDKGHEHINHYYINDNYQGEKREILNKIYEIMNKGNGMECMDSDYGAVPDFYISLNIGEWDRPYTLNYDNRREIQP